MENRVLSENILKKNFVIAGNILVSTKEEIIWTILGSCITVIFFIPSKKLTLFSHAQLPSKDFFNNNCSDTCGKPCFIKPENSHNFKYVSCSINHMIEQLKQFRIKKHEVKSYLIGGASAFNITISGTQNVSEKNIETAKEILNKFNIAYIEDVGGKKSRKVSFNTKTGELSIEEK